MLYTCKRARSIDESRMDRSHLGFLMTLYRESDDLESCDRFAQQGRTEQGTSIEPGSGSRGAVIDRWG